MAEPHAQNDPKTLAKELLSRMTIEEKLFQLSAQIILSVGDEYAAKRDVRNGHYRNPAHFAHRDTPFGKTAAECAELINLDTERCLKASRLGIPPLQNGEALHGAQWGMATCFPQPIALASSFDDGLMAKVADVIGAEVRAVGVRQVFAPVVNLATDCRWGRTVETFGEDACLSGNFGEAMCRGLQKHGVIASPKHFADNFASGGRDSDASERSERTLREVYLKPFRQCFRQGGAHSVMAAYNSLWGVPCSCNHRLLTEILRDEWGFEGFVVSDYSGVEGLLDPPKGNHGLAPDFPGALALALKAGLDVTLPEPCFGALKTAYEKKLINENDINTAVLRVLTEKFRCGLFDEPFADPKKADQLVRCKAHRDLALKAAEESAVLLKNDGVLPIQAENVRRLGVFGPGLDVVPIGQNYSGPYGGWRAPDAKTPYEVLKNYAAKRGIVLVRQTENDLTETAAENDLNLYFSALAEGEGMDRSDIRLPSYTVKKQQNADQKIVGAYEVSIRCDQEKDLAAIAASGKETAVILLGGAPVDVSAWEPSVGAILEAWYPGEQGAKALAELIFGEASPGGKLPLTFPRNVGQLPLTYLSKPGGRNSGYVENDGSPKYEFGFGLSYTDFSADDFHAEVTEKNELKITCRLMNIGKMTGAEVLQVYTGGYRSGVVRFQNELKAYRRVSLGVGEAQKAELLLPPEAFFFFDLNLREGLHDSLYQVRLGTSSKRTLFTFGLCAQNGRLTLL